MTEILNVIANKLKSLRQQKGWSLSTCAEHTGVSKAMLGQIERNESSPTVATLWKIATGMDVSLSALIVDSGQPIQAQAKHPRVTQQGMSVTPLLAYDNDSQQEVYLLSIEPGTESISTAHRQGTQETIMVISGTLDIWVNDQWVQVSEGNAFRFRADQAHGYRNSASGPVVFHDVIGYR